jgi:hypothetical protein
VEVSLGIRCPVFPLRVPFQMDKGIFFKSGGGTTIATLRVHKGANDREAPQVVPSAVHAHRSVAPALRLAKGANANQVRRAFNTKTFSSSSI